MPTATGGGVGQARQQVVHRLRASAVCLGLIALALLQDPGHIIADTKIDLIAHPGQFLARALHMWDPTVSFGQASDQADGYLWPMGPFFLGGAWLGVPAWLTQRLWWALLMCVAYTGVVTLARRLAIGTPAARMVAGLAFALSPRILTEIGAFSIEAWPMALAPWVLVPLIPLAEGARLRRAVTWSALAVACAGGVNATAVFAVVPLALIWLLMLHPLRRRLAALAAWCLAVICATAWWIIPLLVFGRYSPPFLNYTETAAVTTRFTDPIRVIRGASQWVAYLGTPFGPMWSAGAALAIRPILIVATLAVAILGVLGLSRRGMPHRGLLVSGLVVGVALVGLGYVSDLPGTFAAGQREFLDGVGAPLRNAHKFDVVLRLPLALGLAHAVGTVGRLGAVVRRGWRPAWAASGLFVSVAVAAVVAVASPAMLVGLAPAGGFTSVPQYWRDAAGWLDSHAGRDRVLVIPGASFPKYTWGTTGDEITQPLLKSSWAVRNAIPLAPANTIRLLDAVESALATGNGSAGLADLLARSGVRYLLVRSDLDYGRTGSVRPIVVQQALARSGGLSRVAEFGPLIGGDHPADAFIDHGLNVPTRALQVYRVDRQVDPVVTYDLTDVTTVVGGPESLLELAAAGQLSAAPTILAGDLGGHPPGEVAITDGLRRRDVSFGQLHDNTSATLTRDEPFGASAPAHDYLPPGASGQLTTARYQGMTSITASSSAAQTNVIGGSRPQYQPFAALDGDVTSAWRTAPGTPPKGQWLEIELAQPQTVAEVRLVFDVSAQSVPTKVTVTFGAESATVTGLGSTMDIRLPGVHASRRLRITVDEVVGVGGQSGGFGIAEAGISSLVAGRTLVTAVAPQTTTPTPIVLTAAPTIPSCFFVADEPKCAPSAQRASEDGATIDRTVTLPAGGSYLPSIWVRAWPGQSLDTVLDQEVAKANPLKLEPGVTASSTAVADPAGRPGVILDGDAHTSWSPAATDANPLLHMAWLAPRVITGIQLTLPEDTAATRPAAVQVIGNDGIRGGFPDANGIVLFDRPMNTDQITIIFLQPPKARSQDPYTTATDVLPIAVGEIVVLPALIYVNPTVDLDQVVDLPCGSGPTLTTGGITIQTRISATHRDLLQLREVQALPCGSAAEKPISLSSGEQHVTAAPSALATATRLALIPDQPARTPDQSAIRIDSWSETTRQVHVDTHPTDRVLAVRENTNAGWQASVAGRALVPVVLDGWQQGWLVPAGVSGDVVLRFVPDTVYQGGLAAGAVLLVGLLVVALVPARRQGWHVRVSARAPVRRTGRLATLVLGGAGLIVVGGGMAALVVVVGIVAAYYRSVFPRSRFGDSRLRISRTLELWLPAGLLCYGGWLSLTVDSRDTAIGSQIVGLLCVALLWLSVLAQPVGAPSGGQVHERSFEGVEADRREHQRDTQGGDERVEQVAGEVGAVPDQVDAFQDERVP